MKNPEQLKAIVEKFNIEGCATDVRPLGNGLINDSYVVATDKALKAYVLQRINNAIFTDVDLLMYNIEAVTSHIRRKLEAQGADDIDRKVLSFLKTKDNGKLYYYDGESYWRVMKYINGSVVYEAVNPETSRKAGKAFGNFQSMLVDIDTKLEESIPNFHNMEFRLQQLRDAVEADAAGRVAEVRPLLDKIENRADEMTKAELLYREGKLPKRICHCDTKVNNMMFDANDNFLCVIDLDTVMPNFIFSDYGDFLRTGAATLAEDDPDIEHVDFNMDIYKAFTEGYLESASEFLTPLEKENLPFAAALFPYMQAVRFLADYINGDTYYKIKYPTHNLVRTQNQIRLLEKIEGYMPQMKAFVNSL